MTHDSDCEFRNILVPVFIQVVRSGVSRHTYFTYKETIYKPECNFSHFQWIHLGQDQGPAFCIAHLEQAVGEGRPHGGYIGYQVNQPWKPCANRLFENNGKWVVLKDCLSWNKPGDHFLSSSLQMGPREERMRVRTLFPQKVLEEC